MRYACLVYLDETKLDALTDTERVRLRRESVTCEEDLRRSGHLVAAEPLQSVRSATTVRVRATGDRSRSTGPPPRPPSN